MRLILNIALLTLGLTACVTEFEPLTPDVQTQIERRAAEDILGAEAVMESSAFADLTRSNYPIMIALPGVTVNYNNGKLVSDLDSYLENQGLTIEAFLSHPLLDTFVKTHIVKGFVDVDTIRSSEGEEFIYENLNGDEIVFTAKDVTATSGMFLNGVPFDIDCSYDSIELRRNSGQVCYVAAPIEDFDWSQ